LVFDEFRSLFKIADMLHFLDGHPMDLPCRYHDKVACYTTVYIISNIPLNKQYTNVQIDEPSTWQALMRRIQNVYNFDNPIERQILIDGEPNPNPLFDGDKQMQLLTLSEEEKSELPF